MRSYLILPLIAFLLILSKDHWDLSLYSPETDLQEITIKASRHPDWLFPLIINFTKKKEGFKARPYICPGGFLTVGYGDVVDNSKEFRTWTEKQASAKLEYNFNQKLAWVKKVSPEKCNEAQLWAITMLAMNCKMHKWKNSSLKQAVIEYIAIPNQECFSRLQNKWEAWSKIKGKRHKSLVHRRHLEYLIFTGQWTKIKEEYKYYMPPNA
jgi:GH24 family phage-related lysozyme (muramidase)